MNTNEYTVDTGRKIFEIWGKPIVIEYRKDEFPESDGPVYTVEQELDMEGVEEERGDLFEGKDLILMLENHLAKMAVLSLFGFEPVVIEENYVVWEIRQFPFEKT